MKPAEGSPGESRQDATLDQVLDLPVGLPLDEVVDEGSRGLAVGKVGGLGFGVEVLRGRLQEGVEQLEAFLDVDLVCRVQGEVLIAGEGQESLLIT